MTAGPAEEASFLSPVQGIVRRIQVQDNLLGPRLERPWTAIAALLLNFAICTALGAQIFRWESRGARAPRPVWYPDDTPRQSSTRAALPLRAAARKKVQIAGVPVLRTAVPILFTLLGVVSSGAVGTASPAAELRFRWVLPELVDSGPATGRLLVDTPNGPVPPPPGFSVRFGDRTITLGADGTFPLPPFEITGNHFYDAEVISDDGRPLAGEESSVSHHFEVVPARDADGLHLERASALVFPGASFRAEGHGLQGIVRSALQGPGGELIELGRSVGSQLQQTWTAPSDLAPGAYCLVVWDDADRRQAAPEESRLPTVALAGTPVTRVGGRGRITIRSDADVLVQLAGGEPQISLERFSVRVRAGEPAQVPFVAHVVGDYDVSYVLSSPEEPPREPTDEPGEWERADIAFEPLEVSYDPERDRTRVEADCRLTGSEGGVLAGVPVDFALAHPGGVAYQRATSGADGRARLIAELAGSHDSSSLSPHAYRVVGYLFKTPDGDICTVKTDWVRKTPIRVTRALAHHPSDADALGDMIPGTNIALSILADDRDLLRQKCTDCGREAVKRIGPIADQVRYTWGHQGAGRLLSTAGSTAFYQLPDQVRFGRPVTARVTLVVDNPPGKAADAVLRGRLDFRIERTDRVDESLRVRIAITQPTVPTYDDDFREMVGNECNPGAPDWQKATGIAGTPSIPDTLCPGALVLLDGGLSDTDRLVLSCKSNRCTDSDQRLDLPDPLSFSWSDGNAGGSFPLGTQGRRVLYRAPDEVTRVEFALTVTESGTQATDGGARQRIRRESTRRFDLTTVNSGATRRNRNITTGVAYAFTPAWANARQRAKRVRWRTDLGGSSGAVGKRLTRGAGMRPADAALRMTTGRSEEALRVSWRLHSHLHGDKRLRLTAWAEACGDGCVCSDDAWTASDFLTGDAHDRYRLFFAKNGKRDDGRVIDLQNIRNRDEWGETTSLRGHNPDNWFLHWSRETYGTCPYSHRQTNPTVVHRDGSPGYLGRYEAIPVRVTLADTAAADSRRAAFRGRRVWIRTSAQRWFNLSTVRQRAYDLTGHELVNKVFLHEMGHFRSITANWRRGGAWQAAFGNRSTTDVSQGVINLPASNRYSVTLARVGNHRPGRAHGRDAVQKYDIRVRLRGDPNQSDRVTFDRTLAGAWVVRGTIQRQGRQRQLILRGNFEIRDVTQRWVLGGVRFERFARANDPDGDFVPNQVEDRIGTAWNNTRTHTNHARGSATTANGNRQLPDQEFYADHVVIGTAPAGFGLNNAQWAAQVDPGRPLTDWANPGAQSDPPD